MSEVVVIHQPLLPATLAAAKTVTAYLEARGTRGELRSARDLDSPPSAGLRLAICLGGDGTVLCAARWLGGQAVPIVAVKMGRVSFLGELTPDELPNGLDPFLAGDFWQDERAMLSVRHRIG